MRELKLASKKILVFETVTFLASVASKEISPLL